MVLAQRWLQRVAHLLDAAFEGRPTAELFTVMICCPLLMNMVQVRASPLCLLAAPLLCNSKA